MNTKPKPFKQPSAAKMNHPARNLGNFLHPRAKAKAVPKQTLATMKEVAANMQGMDASDTNSEAIGSMMGPTDESTTPPAFKRKATKTSQKIPFYGNM